MNLRRHIVTLGTAALLFTASAGVAAGPAYERGLEATHNYRHAEALMHFTAAAEQGDRAAQRNLGLMLLYGDLLYGREVPRDQERGKKWLRAAAAQGCEVSSLMLKTLAQHGH